MSKAIKSLTFYPDGTVMAFDTEGNDMPDIQAVGWMECYFNRLHDMGHGVFDTPMIRARLNDGTWKQVIVKPKDVGDMSIEFKPIEHHD